MQNKTSYILPDTNRLPWLDFASGIMILWMIVYHAIGCAWAYELRDLWGITDASLLPEGLHAFINNEGKLELLNPCVVFPCLHFFMPWFFYKSGMFFKKHSAKDLWKKDSQKLLKTFAIWSAVGYAFFLLTGLLNDSLTFRGTTYSVIRGLFLRGQIPINRPLWFLLTLFAVRFLANKLLPDYEDRYSVWRIFVIVVIGYIISFFLYHYNHRLLPYWVANSASGLSFFALGYMMRDRENKWLVIIPCSLVYVLGSIMGFPIVEMFHNVLITSNYFLWIPISFCCIVTFNFLCKLINCTQFKLIEWIGRNAMVLYVTHYIVLFGVSTIFEYYDVQISSGWLLCIMLFVCALILPLFSLLNCDKTRKM